MTIDSHNPLMITYREQQALTASVQAAALARHATAQHENLDKGSPGRDRLDAEYIDTARSQIYSDAVEDSDYSGRPKFKFEVSVRQTFSTAFMTQFIAQEIVPQHDNKTSQNLEIAPNAYAKSEAHADNTGSQFDITI